MGAQVLPDTINTLRNPDFEVVRALSCWAVALVPRTGSAGTHMLCCSKATEPKWLSPGQEVTAQLKAAIHHPAARARQDLLLAGRAHGVPLRAPTAWRRPRASPPPPPAPAQGRTTGCPMHTPRPPSRSASRKYSKLQVQSCTLSSCQVVPDQLLCCVAEAASALRHILHLEQSMV